MGIYAGSLLPACQHWRRGCKTSSQKSHHCNTAPLPFNAMGQINGTTYNKVLRYLAQKYNKPIRAVKQTYHPRLFTLDRSDGSGTCIRPGITRLGLPASFKYQVHADGSVSVNEMTEQEAAKPVVSGPEWPKHWKARIKAVQGCKNIDALEALLETETSAAVEGAIRLQIEDCQ